MRDARNVRDSLTHNGHRLGGRVGSRIPGRPVCGCVGVCGAGVHGRCAHLCLAAGGRPADLWVSFQGRLWPCKALRGAHPRPSATVGTSCPVCARDQYPRSGNPRRPSAGRDTVAGVAGGPAAAFSPLLCCSLLCSSLPSGRGRPRPSLAACPSLRPDPLPSESAHSPPNVRTTGVAAAL